MDRETSSIQKITGQKILPLFYHSETAVCIELVKTLYRAGMHCVEFTNRGEHALNNFKELCKERNHNMPGLLLGAGTIKTAKEAEDFTAAGADFLISPVFDASVCDAAYMNKLLWIPGCATPTEIHTAAQAGCTLIKLFPGNTLGPGFVEAVKPLFTGVDFMVTGGVEPTTENIQSWLKAGAACVGMGSKLISKNILENKDYQLLFENSSRLLGLAK